MIQDNQANQGAMPPMRIDVNDKQALKYWTDALQVTEEDLQRAVAEVGPMVGDVCRKLHVRPN